MVSWRGKDLRLALGSEKLRANEWREWRRTEGIKANFLYRNAWFIKYKMNTFCIRTVGSTYSDALSLTSTPQKQCLVDASNHLVTYVLTCLKQHTFPSCSSLPFKVGNAHTCHSSAFSPLFHHTIYSIPNQASSFFPIHTYICEIYSNPL